MKKILILDKDNTTLRNLIRSLQSYDDLDIIVAKERNQVNRALQQLSIDLAILDIEGTEQCCFDLVESLNQQFPTLPVNILSAALSVELESKLNTLDISRSFLKPVDVDEVAETIHSQLTNNATGQLQGLSLTSILQLMNMEKKHCTLTISTTTDSGELFIHNGEIVAAQTGGLTGKDAVYNILSWEKVVISLLNNHHDTTREIAEPFMALILEALRLKDENKLPAITLAENNDAEKIKPKAQPLSAVEKQIITLLDNSPDIIEYSIYDRQNNLRYFYSKRKQTRNRLRPQRMREKADKIGAALHAGAFKYALINEKNGPRHLFFPFHGYCITVGLQRYQNVNKFLNQLQMEFE